ncbi:ATP-binding protein [Streptomyces sp. MAR4 CNX-425]|uniref:ATP-binding protein n=1 Tax=Streptomyces sp. MAR4 CNX-425 TaxID=3406343 RepID=UPI003B50BB81
MTTAGSHAADGQSSGQPPTGNEADTKTTYARLFARSAASVGKARDFVATVVGAGDRTDDIRVCVSEVATNALQHTPAGRRFLVRIIINEGVVRIEVHDAGGGTPRMCTPADTDDRGRGLMLVAAFADDWGSSGRLGPGKFVWMEFKIQAAVEGTC